MGDLIKARLDELEQSLRASQESAAADVDRAGHLAAGIVAQCPEFLDISGAIDPRKYAPLPVDQGRSAGEETHRRTVEYSVDQGVLLNSKRLPVDSSADFAREFIHDCQTGLIDLVKDVIIKYRNSDGLR